MFYYSKWEFVDKDDDYDKTDWFKTGFEWLVNVVWAMNQADGKCSYLVFWRKVPFDDLTMVTMVTMLTMVMIANKTLIKLVAHAIWDHSFV